MSVRIPRKYSSRIEAAKQIAKMLGYSLQPGKVYETPTQFAEALGLPADGGIPVPLRVRIEDYLAPPLEPDKEVWSDGQTLEEEEE